MPDSNYINAFVSCSLRKEDKWFTNIVCNILLNQRIRPFGTVGKFDSSPENPVELMRRNIPLADLVVIVVTPRYVQYDISTGNFSLGLSDMIHTETGMAIGDNKPVVVFVQEGTNIESALPNVTQFIVLNGHQDDYDSKKGLIHSLLNNCKNVVFEVKKNRTIHLVFRGIIIALAIYGAFRLVRLLIRK